jgi:plastocyanin
MWAPVPPPPAASSWPHAGQHRPATVRAAAPARLLVTATEFRFALSRGTLKAGPAVVQLADRGEDAHDLVLRRLNVRGREHGPRRTVAETQPGAVTTRSFTLAAGRYVLFCSLPGHRRLGMQARVTVRR